MTGKKLIKLAADEDDDEFPSLLDDIREYFGDEVADKLQEAVGGTRISVTCAEGMREDSIFARAVGFETALKIAEMFFASERGHRMEILIPMGETKNVLTLRRRMHEMLVEGGYSARFIANVCCVHERTVYRERARLRQQGVTLGESNRANENKHLALTEELQRLVETLLIEGFAPSTLRQYLRVGGGFITKIRNKLIKEGKLTC